VIRRTEGFLSGVGGVRLYHRAWEPEGAVIGRVTIAHGFAEHGERYAHVADKLTRAGFAVSVLDHRGHGRSGGARTTVTRFTDYSEDLLSLVDDGTRRWPGAPSFLLGHSLGGMIALDFALAHADRLRGLVLSAPAVCLPAVSRARVVAGRAMSRVAPRAPVRRLPFDRISRDPAVVRAYNEDPLVHRTPVKARLGAEWLAAMERVEAALPSLRLPLLVMQGSKDALVDPGCGPSVAERAGSSDKTLKMYEGLWHEIFNEPERERVIADLVSWLEDHAGGRR
jgi:alpha-beta hydrolase superfamily lysophospholipase